MKFNSKVICLVFTVAAFGDLSQAQTSADNSKINSRDSSANELTADQQKSNTSDTKITAQIRRDIMKEANLSTYAQNIKIITVDGKVTLKGPVRTMMEENIILEHARSVAGVANVIDEIAIVPK